jgi:hypothetical protein
MCYAKAQRMWVGCDRRVCVAVLVYRFGTWKQDDGNDRFANAANGTDRGTYRLALISHAKEQREDLRLFVLYRATFSLFALCGPAPRPGRPAHPLPRSLGLGERIKEDAKARRADTTRTEIPAQSMMTIPGVLPSSNTHPNLAD